MGIWTQEKRMENFDVHKNLARRTDYLFSGND